MEIIGYTHSFETCGTVDGPGIRFVVFMQGCHLRCQYCHNPDTWKLKTGNKVTPEQVMKEILKYRSYMNFSGGGVTISGGEPLLQPEFLTELFVKCRENNIHTTIDTAGYHEITPQIEKLISLTDLFLLDIKSIVPEKFEEITGGKLETVLNFAKYLSNLSIPVWVRHVIVPGLTDSDREIRMLARHLTTLTNVEKVELIPFHKMGEYKWEQMKYKYLLQDTPSADPLTVEKAKAVFVSMGFNV